jgi:hypothetical protein
MAVTTAQVKLLGAELASIDDVTIQAWIDDAELELSEDVLEEKYDLAVKYLAAHKAKLASPGGASGTVKSVAVGGVSRTYADGAADAGAYGRTSYGQEFWRIISSIAACRFGVSS